jgi:hypothetical protein
MMGKALWDMYWFLYHLVTMFSLQMLQSLNEIRQWSWWREGNNLEENGCILYQSAIPAFSLKDEIKPRKPSVRTTGNPGLVPDYNFRSLPLHQPVCSEGRDFVRLDVKHAWFMLPYARFPGPREHKEIISILYV